MSSNKSVLVVVLNYNGWKDTEKCMRTLLKSDYKNFKVLLIDNGSNDDSVKILSKIKSPKLEFWQEPENLGFAGGVNVGIRKAIEEKFEYVALLNNDAQVEKDWIKNLVGILDTKKDVGIATGLLLDASGTKIDDAGDEYTTWGIPSLRAEGLPKKDAPESGYVFGATGGATLYRVSLFKKIGLFDDVFFAYDEDVDIDWRAQLAGYKIWYEKSAVAYHKHSATSKKMPGFTTRQVFKNLPLVVYKNVPGRLFLPIWLKFCLAYWMFFGFKLIKGEAWPALKGIGKSITLIPHALRERRKIQKTRKVEIKYINSILTHAMPYNSIKRVKKFFKRDNK